MEGEKFYWWLVDGRVYPMTPFSVASWCNEENRRGVVVLGFGAVTQVVADNPGRWRLQGVTNVNGK